MKKQTAVDWLNSELERLSNQIGVNLSWDIVDDLIKQAKEIEKEQIIYAHHNGAVNCLHYLEYGTGQITPKEYYNKNFK